MVLFAIPILFLVARIASRQGDVQAAGSRGDFRKEAPISVSPTKYFVDSQMVELITAALSKDAAAVKRLTAQGVPVNGLGKQGLSALHVVLLNFNFDAFALLLDVGADPNLAADNGTSVMNLAAMTPDSRFLSAALRHGGQVDLRDGRKETPLMIAASNSLDDNVRLLVEADADVNAKDARGSTPLMHAFQSFKPSPGIARQLLGAGARSGDRDPLGLTARDYAKTFEDPALLEVFPR